MTEPTNNSKRRVLGSPLKTKPAIIIPPVPEIEPSDSHEPNGSSKNNTPQIRSPTTGSSVASPNGDSGQLSCPICSETMVSLRQLNRHIDDAHTGNGDANSSLRIPSTNPIFSPSSSRNSSPSPSPSPSAISFPKAINNDFLTGSVTKWIRSNFEGAADLSPPPTSSSPSKRKTVRLDLLDKNKGFSLSDTLSGTASPTSNIFIENDPPHPNGTHDGAASPARNRQGNKLKRSHWQQPSSMNSDHCADQTCRKTLNIKNGKVNCRKCGLLFCNEHTYYKMKLKNPAKAGEPLVYDPTKDGVWARVCSSCYGTKPEDNGPLFNDITSAFKKKRQECNDDKELSRNKLQKRFIKLVNLHSEYYLSTKGSATDGWWNPFPVSKWSSTEVLEQEKAIVGNENWQLDSHVQSCPICFSKFNFITRRHHCRVCGRIVCDGTLNNKEIICSMDVPINLFLVKKLKNLNFSPLVLQNIKELSEIKDDNDKYRFRCCMDCKDDLLHDWKKVNITGNSSHPGLVESDDTESIFKLYDQILLVKESIHGLFPKYENLVANYQETSDLDEINKLRVRLMSFLRDLESLISLFKKSYYTTRDNVLVPVDRFGPNFQKVINNIHQSSATYLQETLIHIKLLTNDLKDKENKELKVHQKFLSEATEANNSSKILNGNSEVSKSDKALPGSPAAMPSTSGKDTTASDLTKRQIRELREQLMVMNEQKFIIESLVETVTKSRKFDELRPLLENKNELENTIKELEEKLGSYGF